MAKPDWEAIETAYRAGVMSLREIASQHGISEGAIRKRAKRNDLPRCWILICLLMTVTAARTGIIVALSNGLLSNLAG